MFIQRPRGRPRKEHTDKKNDDPDFTPVNSGKQAPPVLLPSTVTTDRKPRKKVTIVNLVKWYTDLNLNLVERNIAYFVNW